MDLNLTGKSVFVAGSSRGIGRAIAEGFLAEGARVTVSGRVAGAVEETRSVLAARHGDDAVFAVSGDLTVADDIQSALTAAAECMGGIDVLVANVGSGSGTGGWDLTHDDWDGMLNMNLVGSMLIAGEAAKMMRDAGNGGSITFISSIAGMDALPAPIPYSAAKSALQHGAKNLSRQLGRENIRVNVVAPGNVLFPGGTWDRKQKEDAEGVAAFISAEVPLDRFATPQEIADAVLFLSSERAAFITGALLTVDGGQTRS